jgi:DNA repair exonuclease SbcCD ATPase subunit
VAEKTLTAAGEYWGRVQRLGMLHSQEKGMVEALHDADTTVAEAKEAEILESTVPRLRAALRAQSGAAKAEVQATIARQAAAKVDVAAGENAVGKTTEAHAATRLKHQEILKLLSETRSALEQLAPEIDKAKELLRLEDQIRATSDEVSKLEEKFAGIALVRTKVERLRKLETAGRLIATYRKAREVEAIAKAGAEDGDPEAELLRRRTRRIELEVEAKAAASVESDSQNAVARAEAILGVTQSTLRRREEAGAAGTCSHCGQKVSPAHIKKEISAARAATKTATSALSTAQQTSDAAKKRRQSADADVARAMATETQASECATSARRAREEIEELQQSDGFAELPADVVDLLKSPLADLQLGITSLIAAQAEKSGLERELTQLAAAESAAAAKSELVRGWKKAVDDVLAVFTRDRLAVVQQLEISLQQELKTMQPLEVKSRTAEEIAAGAAASARKSLSELQQRQRELGEEARLADQRAVGFRQEASGALTGVADNFLPVSPKVIDEVDRRLGQLDGAAKRLAILRKAENEVEGLRGQIKELRALIDVTPEEHRVPVDLAKKALASAQEHAATAQQDARSNRRAADELRKNRQDRLIQQAAADQLAIERAVWEKAGQLLGRGGIQTALMRSALEDIQERANGLLSRISGGQLQLDVTFEQTSRGEEIYFSCVDAASSELPLDVQFLSGGQRFRCAVALAAGIGQRAGSKGAMPSQIIDEGFGSLDTKGRAEMLDEIRQMSEFYERVIVVSHLESFHDQSLFPARFELTKEGTRTVVTMVA